MDSYGSVSPEYAISTSLYGGTKGVAWVGRTVSSPNPEYQDRSALSRKAAMTVLLIPERCCDYLKRIMASLPVPTN